MPEQARTVRQFRSLVDGLTLPGAGLTPGVVSGRPFAHKGELVSENELGDAVLARFDDDDPHTVGLLEEVDPAELTDVEEEPEEGSDVEVPVGEGAGDPSAAADTAEPGEAGDLLIEPFEGYNALSAKDIVARMQEADDEEVARIKEYEALQPQPRSTITNFERGAAAG